jgi:hypothetical protein
VQHNFSALSGLSESVRRHRKFIWSWVFRESWVRLEKNRAITLATRSEALHHRLPTGADRELGSFAGISKAEARRHVRVGAIILT